MVVGCQAVTTVFINSPVMTGDIWVPRIHRQRVHLPKTQQTTQYQTQIVYFSDLRPLNICVPYQLQPY